MGLRYLTIFFLTISLYGIDYTGISIGGEVALKSNAKTITGRGDLPGESRLTTGEFHVAGSYTTQFNNEATAWLNRIDYHQYRIEAGDAVSATVNGWRVGSALFQKFNKRLFFWGEWVYWIMGDFGSIDQNWQKFEGDLMILYTFFDGKLVVGVGVIAQYAAGALDIAPIGFLKWRPHKIFELKLGTEYQRLIFKPFNWLKTGIVSHLKNNMTTIGAYDGEMNHQDMTGDMGHVSYNRMQIGGFATFTYNQYYHLDIGAGWRYWGEVIVSDQRRKTLLDDGDPLFEGEYAGTPYINFALSIGL